jgi:hypothetical protein
MGDDGVSGRDCCREYRRMFADPALGRLAREQSDRAPVLLAGVRVRRCDWWVTTFLTFGLDTFMLNRTHSPATAFVNVAIQIFGGLVAVWAG